ncbi:MAG: hypothetical protein ABR559_09270 [Gemmatimonadota bacterium]
MPHPLSRLAVAAMLVALACQAESEPQAERGARRVVVRSTPSAALPSAQADGRAVGPADGAPEIVILPDRQPETRTRVIYRTVPEAAQDAPAPSGLAADLTGAGAALPAPRPGGQETALLPAERTQINVTATTTLSSDDSRVGDPVTAETAEPVMVDGEVIIPAGSRVEGRVTAVDRGEYPTRRPSIDIVYDRIETPDGEVIPIEARTSGEVGTVVQHPRGDHSRMRNILLGAGVGGAMGGATGGKRGAILGGIAGAAAGAGMGSGGVDWCAGVHPGDGMLIIFNRDAIVRRGPVIMNLSGR